MKKVWKWVVLFLAVLIVAFLIAVPLFRIFLWKDVPTVGWMPMMGRGFQDSHMFRGYGFFWGGPIMLGVLLAGLVIVGLAVWGAIALFRIRKPQLQTVTPVTSEAVPPVVAPSTVVPPAETTPSAAVPLAEAPSTVGNCSHCGKPLQAEWTHCPYCGEKV